MSTSEMLRELGEIIAGAQPDAVIASHVANAELTLEVTPAGLRSLVGYLSENAACRFTKPQRPPIPGGRFFVATIRLSVHQEGRHSGSP